MTKSENRMTNQTRNPKDERHYAFRAAPGLVTAKPEGRRRKQAVTFPAAARATAKALRISD
jgi:hypothetical protein